LNSPESRIRPSRLESTVAVKKFRLSSLIGKSAFVVILLTGGIVGLGSLMERVNLLGPNHDSDNVSESEKQNRSQAFAAMGSIQLSVVDDRDIDTAINSMQLASAAKQVLRADVLSTTAQSVTAPATSAAPTRSSAQHQTVAQAQSAAMPAKSEQTKLAWITLWDTDSEDGDVVRIDSQGYSRTVTLTTKPVVFAIPVPADGIIKVTGILDGEGGGITVGLASGASKAVFPIMSVGQVLGLHVKIK